MYDYLAKIILLGPSGTGKSVGLCGSEISRAPPTITTDTSFSCRSCLLHRFVKNEWRVLSSQTIGVEFASKIIKVGTGARRKRIKLQVRNSRAERCHGSDANYTSSGTRQAPSGSAPFRDHTIAAPRARSSSTTSPRMPRFEHYNHFSMTREPLRRRT